jgi:hypothetical protein
MADVEVELRAYGAVAVEGGEPLIGKLVVPTIDGGRPARTTAQGTYVSDDEGYPSLMVHSFVEGDDVLLSFIKGMGTGHVKAHFYRMPGWALTRFAIDAGYRLVWPGFPPKETVTIATPFFSEPEISLATIRDSLRKCVGFGQKL